MHEKCSNSVIHQFYVECGLYYIYLVIYAESYEKLKNCNIPLSSSFNTFTDIFSEPSSLKRSRTVQKEPNKPPSEHMDNVEDKTSPSDGFKGQT